MKKQGQLSDNVLINLGANGPVNAKQIDAIEKVVGKHRKLFWVNVHVPTQTWEGSVNQTLNKATKKYDNLQIIDWNGPAKNQPGWFYGDHVHPNPEGSKEYASLVAKAIIKAVQ